jgi:hypothetical protein
MIRTSTVSTSQLRNYKTIVLVLNGLILLIFIALVIYINYFDGHVDGLLGFLSIYLILNIFTQLVFRLKNVSYDNSSVYYSRKGYEVQIPFEDIKSVEIKTPTGIYSIKLFEPTQNGKEIFFKTSIWYPLSFKRQDEKVNELRAKIDTYKRRISEQNIAELPSYQI